MKVRVILLAAGVSLAAISTSFAQPTTGFSENAVGYVNVTIPPGGYRLIANPLENGDNSLNTILQLPDEFVGTSIYRFNCAIQSYRETMQWVSGQWLTSDPADLIVAPGEGFFIQNVAGAPLPITFMGDVPVGPDIRNTILGNNHYCIEASIVPYDGRLGWLGNPDPTTLGFPVCTGDSIFIFDPVIQSYRETYQYVEGTGWLHDVDPLDGPYIDVAQGFFVQRVCSDNAIWHESYSVDQPSGIPKP